MSSNVNKFVCPRCGGGIPNEYERGAYPGAMSRWDNETEICSACGQDEALRQFYGHDVSPRNPDKLWVNPPMKATFE
jgi:ribosomal protein L37E